MAVQWRDHALYCWSLGYTPLYSATLVKPEDDRDKEHTTCPTDRAGHSHVHRGSKESESHDYVPQTSNPFIPLKSQRFASWCVIMWQWETRNSEAYHMHCWRSLNNERKRLYTSVDNKIFIFHETCSSLADFHRTDLPHSVPCTSKFLIHSASLCYLLSLSANLDGRERAPERH